MKTIKNPFKRFRGKHSLTIFDSAKELCGHVSGACSALGFKRQLSGIRGGFYSNSTFDDVLTGVISGDKELAERAASLVKKVNAEIAPTVRKVRRSSPRGRAMVGAYLAGDPMPARRRVAEKVKSAPVNVVVSLNSIANCEARDLERRGVAIAALVKALIMQRPVNLYLSRFSTNSKSSSAMLVRFPTAPCDSYRLAYLLSNQAFCRGVGFAFHNTDSYRTDAPAVRDGNAFISFAGDGGYSQTRHCDYARDLADYFGEEVFYVPGSDANDPLYKAMTRDPIAWVNDTVKELGKLD